MSGDRYIIQYQHYIHFLTFSVVDWVDLFTRPEYKKIITNSLNYCINNKGMRCYAWVLMSNHLHIIVDTQSPHKLSDVIRDMKKHTSKKLTDMTLQIPKSRREWLLLKFSYMAQSS